MKAPADYQPVLIIGAARSGTKFLRDILSRTAGVATVPYDVNYVWRYGNSERADDELSEEDATERVRRFVRSTLPSIAGFDAARDRFLLEKTVSNGLRIPFVDRILPEARYIALVRDGRAVAESAMRQWQAPPKWGDLLEKLKGMPLSNYSYAAWFAMNYGRGLLSRRGGGKVWGPRYLGLDADVDKESLAFVCARQWSRVVDSTEVGMRSIPADRRFVLRYEDLVRDDAQLTALLAWLEWPAAPAIEAYRRAVSPLENRKWQEILTPADRDAIERAAGPTLARLGYRSSAEGD